jgi:serine/threonine protein kinase/tetratricopeptide (TPR) repeat protein
MSAAAFCPGRMTIPQGTQFGPYRILEQIGSGGMGEVYRALDTRLEREVALKLVSESYLAADAGSPSPAATPHSRAHLSNERFLREARSAATLSHPNICAIYDVGEQDGRPYLVMELLRGETLKKHLAESGGHGLGVDEVATFSQQAAAALVAAHGKGIVHRDIKPANLFVAEAARGLKQIKILDFGLAKKQGAEASPDSRAVNSGGKSGSGVDATATGMPGRDATSGPTGTVAGGDLTTPGSTMGTVAYMSPEQAKGEPLDARTDLFSLGSVMYEMATGKSPFRGESTAEVFAALLKENPPPVSKVNPAMPKRLDPIMTKLLAKDKTQRYPSAEALQEDLDGLNGTGGSRSGRPGQSADTRKALVRMSLAAIVLLLLAGGYTWWKHHEAASGRAGAAAGTASDAGEAAGSPKEKKDSIILADFQNQTGDPVFETTLNQALRIALEQSPVINIVSQDHLRQSVKYLGKPEDTPVTPAIAREIGEREGMKAILTGTIAKLGTQYVITLSAQNTATGDEIASEQATAPDKEHVLDAVGTAAAAMRGKLGEDLASIKKLYTPFGETTTPSLEAFRAYALGDDAHQKGLDIPEAEGYYKRALELDPNFAMAYARLGVIYVNSGQVAKADEFFKKAYEQSKHVSDRERLYIAGHYEEDVTGNIPKEIETLQESIQTYPGQLDSYTNLNAAYGMVGQFAKALPYGKKATELQPDDAISSENLVGDYIGLGEMREAQQEMARAHTLGLDNSTSIVGEDMIAYFLLGDAQGVQRILTQSVGRPDEFLVTGFLAATQEFSGQYGAAKASFERAYEQAGRQKAPDVQANMLLQMAAGRGLAGICEGSDATVKQALGLDKSKQTMETAALALTICGNGKQALPMMEDLGRKYPEDTLIQDVYSPLVKGFAALAAGQAQQALSDVEPALPYDTVYPASYLQGLAYLQLHDAGKAVAAFKAATKSPGGNFVGAMGVQPIFYALGQLGLARAYAMAGDKAEAKKAYEALFVTWKNADADLPPLMAAKKEYAAL